jgi:hypothetical protein
MRTTPCECTGPGWCERHRCLKFTELFEQCQANQHWFDRWERGEGPCLPLHDTEGPDGGPSLAARAVNFGTAIIHHVANGMQQADDATYEVRLATCRQCASCDTDRMVCRQPSCGCSLTIKARWASENCPLQLWPRASSATGEAAPNTLNGPSPDRQGVGPLAEPVADARGSETR